MAVAIAATVSGVAAPPTGPPAAPERVTVQEAIDNLTAAMSAGDGGAVERFYRRYFDCMYGWARQFTRRDESFCLDVVHDAVLRIVRTIRRADSEPQLLAWLRLVVQTTAYDKMKSDRRRETRETAVVVPPDDTPAAAPADAAAIEAERLDWLRTEIAALDPQLAAMLDLRFTGGWTLDRIGRLFGLSPGTVDGRLRRTLRRLRDRAGAVDDG